MFNHPVNTINEFFNNKQARKILLKLRLPLGLLVFAAIATQIKAAWFFPGLIVSLLGEIGQVWCFSTIKTRKKLTVVGPYMFMRNPMYISRFFLIFGILMMTGNPWIMALFLVLYYFYMTNRVKREEKDLLDLFGEDYASYCREVNRYVPGLNRYDRKLLWSFNKESFRQNHALINISAALFCYVVLFLAAFVWKPF